ncbi:uncharacterized protein LOC144827942 [Lissotriton helveticus]
MLTGKLEAMKKKAKKKTMTMVQNVTIAKLTSPSAMIADIGKKCEESALGSLKDGMKAGVNKVLSTDGLLPQSLGEKGSGTLEAMKKKTKKKAMTMIQNVNITKLTSPTALITDIGKKCEESAWESLKDATSTLSRFKSWQIYSAFHASVADKMSIIEQQYTYDISASRYPSG